MKYVTYDASGNLTGAFWQDLLPEHAANFIAAADAEYANWVNLKANAARNGFDVKPPPTQTVQQIADAALLADADATIRNDTLVATWRAKTWATFSADFDLLTQANKLELLKRSAFINLHRNL